ncbi:MAG: hypothetical protein ASARMPRED_006881 [Alectoria sarmentosa]|nr:MAG: hypothetical protein ASARMPRED_006881 [Alectoria sarmentosa]
MAPPRKASVQQGGPKIAQSPTATPRNARHPRRRSASPPNQPTSIRTRDEPPAHSTRSSFSAPSIIKTLPTANQRIPIECPVVACLAQTLHQHLPELQYYNPRPGRAVHHHGYGDSSGDIASRSSLVVTLRIGSRDQGTAQLEPEAAENEVVARGYGSHEQEALTEGDTTLPESPPASSDLNVDRGNPQDAGGLFQRLPRQTRDFVHDDGTSSLFRAPMTPPPSSPMAAEEGSSAQETTGSGEQPDEQETAAPPAPRMQFGDWLPGHGPEENVANPSSPHVHTYDELIRPLVDPTLPPAPGMEEITRILQGCQSLTDPSYRPGVDEEDPDLPSLMMRPPITEYMRQFQEQGDEDFDMETYMWQ